MDAIVARIQEMLEEMHQAQIDADSVSDRSAAIHHNWLATPQTVVTKTHIVRVY